MDFSTLAEKYSAELSYIDALFKREGITYEQEDILLALDSAWRAIVRYMWLDTLDYDSNYSTCLIRLALAYYNNSQIEKGNLKGVIRVSQQTQGSRSVTFASNTISIDSNGLTAEVKAMLPVRKLRVL